MPFSLLFAVGLALHGGTADTTVRLVRGATVEITAPQCAVIAKVGTDDRLIISGGTVEASRTNAEVLCGTYRPGRPRNDGGTLRLTLPVGVRVEVHTAEGDIQFTGETERLDISSMSGSITLAKCGGRAELTTVAGSMTITDFIGTALTINAVQGEVNATNIATTGRFEVIGVNGGMRLRGIRAASVTATSVNGTIDFGGVLRPDGTYTFESHNGNIALSLPPTLSARVHVSSFLGSFESDFKGTVSGRRVEAPVSPVTPRNAGGRAPPLAPVTPHAGGEEFAVTYGKGEAHLSVETFNGSIRLLAAKP